MKKFLLILACCIALLSCVSIAVTQVNGDDNNTDHQTDDTDQVIGVNNDQ